MGISDGFGDQWTPGSSAEVFEYQGAGCQYMGTYILSQIPLPDLTTAECESLDEPVGFVHCIPFHLRTIWRGMLISCK